MSETSSSEPKGLSMSLDDLIKHASTKANGGSKFKKVSQKRTGDAQPQRHNRQHRPYNNDNRKHHNKNSRNEHEVLEVTCRWENEGTDNETFSASVDSKLLIEVNCNGTLIIGHEIRQSKISLRAYNVYLKPLGYKILYEDHLWFLSRVEPSAWKKTLNEQM